MKKILPLSMLLVFLISCGNNVKNQPQETDALKVFFNLCVSDLDSAKKVIIDNDLVKNLTHLQSMDHGGKKYYLLERESITKMLKSVTEGLYSDYILINKSGLIIYTMVRDEYFSKNVKSTVKNTGLNRCYLNHKSEYHVEDSFLTFERDADKFLFFSTTVQGGETFPGVLILEINPGKILKLAGPKSKILNLQGEVLISENEIEIGKPFSSIDSMILNPVYGKIFSFRADNNRYTYRFFKYLNIEWIILNEM